MTEEPGQWTIKVYAADAFAIEECAEEDLPFWVGRVRKEAELVGFAWRPRDRQRASVAVIRAFTSNHALLPFHIHADYTIKLSGTPRISERAELLDLDGRVVVSVQGRRRDRVPVLRRMLVVVRDLLLAEQPIAQGVPHHDEFNSGEGQLDLFAAEDALLEVIDRELSAWDFLPEDLAEIISIRSTLIAQQRSPRPDPVITRRLIGRAMLIPWLASSPAARRLAQVVRVRDVEDYEDVVDAEIVEDDTAQPAYLLEVIRLADGEVVEGLEEPPRWLKSAIGAADSLSLARRAVLTVLGTVLFTNAVSALIGFRPAVAVAVVFSGVAFVVLGATYD